MGGKRSVRFWIAQGRLSGFFDILSRSHDLANSNTLKFIVFHTWHGNCLVNSICCGNKTMKNILTRLSLACLGLLAVGATDYARADAVYHTVTGFDAATTNNTLSASTVYFHRARRF